MAKEAQETWPPATSFEATSSIPREQAHRRSLPNPLLGWACGPPELHKSFMGSHSAGGHHSQQAQNRTLTQESVQH